LLGALTVDEQLAVENGKPRVIDAHIGDSGVATVVRVMYAS
jgi:hypothetical protein